MKHFTNWLQKGESLENARFCFWPTTLGNLQIDVIISAQNSKFHERKYVYTYDQLFTLNECLKVGKTKYKTAAGFIKRIQREINTNK